MGGGIISILLGAYLSLIGFRVISAGKKQGPEYEAWYQKWGSKFKIIGPVLILLGIAGMIIK